ncbi:MAG: ABC transporter permease [Chloroflexi bacterium]|nr:ABC transporter permease [Chloroflexota bacterium]
MAFLRETYYLYLRNLRVWVAQPMNVISPLLMAAFFFFLFGAPLSGVTQLPGFPSGDYHAFLAPMVLVQAAVFTGSDLGFAMLTDILSGYFDKLLLAPINRLSILLGNLLVGATRALAQALVILLVALALGVSVRGGIAGVLMVLLLATVFGLAWSSLGLMIAIRTRNVQLTQSTWLLFMPFAFLTTAFMPREFLPRWLQIAVMLNPVNYVLEAVRAIIVQGWEWEVILPGIWVLAAMTVVFTALATWLYRRATV